MPDNTSIQHRTVSLTLSTLIQKLIHLFYYLWMFCVIAFSDTVTIYANLCALAVMGLCALALLGKRRIHLPKRIGMWLLFVAFGYLSCLWSISPGTSETRMNSVLLMTVMLLCVTIFAVSYEDKTFLFDGFELVSLALCVYVVAFYGVDIMIDAIRNGSLERIGEEFVNSNALGILLALGSLVTLYKALVLDKTKRVWLAIVPIIIALLTGSRKTLAIVAVGLVYIFFMRGYRKPGFNRRNAKSLLLTTVIIAALLLLYNSPTGSLVKQRVESMFSEDAATDSSALARMEMIQAGLLQFKENPLFGCGIGASDKLTSGSYLHNNYIELLATTGLVGFVLYYGFVLSYTLTYLMKVVKKTATYQQGLVFLFCILVFVIDLGSVSYFTKTTYMIFAMLAAFVNSNEQSKGEIVND